MWLLAIAALVLGLGVGFAACFLTLVRAERRKAAALLQGLNSGFKTVERKLGTCACGVSTVVLDIVPNGVSLSTNFTPKLVVDPLNGKKIQQFRSLGSPATVG